MEYGIGVGDVKLGTKVKTVAIAFEGETHQTMERYIQDGSGWEEQETENRGY